jgi:outer membrane protein assembly factor BamA
MVRSRLLSLFALLCALPLHAQTYTPKTIRLQGPGDLDQAAILRLVDLKPGTPLTREQIEAAMQRLADSGLFSDLSYKVDGSALVFVLTPAAGSQAQPVRYSNFVWWQPAELESLVEARVPLFHGKLPLAGQLTTEVEAALAALLAQKGIANAKVDAMQSSVGGGGLALTISQPEITVGEVHVEGTAPDAIEQMNKVTARLAGRDFDSAETPGTIVNNTLDTHRNAGYLDATVDPPTFSAPHKDMQGYAVDATATVHPGALYRIASITYTGADPALEPEIAKAETIKVGDPAQQMTARIAAGLAARTLSSSGHLEAKATAQVSKDSSAHTASYTIALTPGPVYTFAAVDTNGLSSTAQAQFAKAFHAQPGVVANRDLTVQIMRALQAAGVLKTATLSAKLDRSAHTVTYAIVSRAASGQDPDPAQP